MNPGMKREKKSQDRVFDPTGLIEKIITLDTAKTLFLGSWVPQRPTFTF